MTPPEPFLFGRWSQRTLLLCLCAVVGCVRAPPGSSRAIEVPEQGGIGLYRARIDAPGGSRKFRLRLWVGTPARLRAEVLSPIGQTVLILDGGADQLSVLDVSTKTSYTGGPEDTRDAFGRWLGFAWTSEEMVEAILGTGSLQEPWTTVRQGQTGRLPSNLKFKGQEINFSLELKRWSPEPSGRGPGVATVPDGYEARPLSEWEADG